VETWKVVRVLVIGRLREKGKYLDKVKRKKRKESTEKEKKREERQRRKELKKK
jgi:hypothetical protein